MIEAYRNTIDKCNLSGPTNFASIISEINDHVSHLEVSQQKQKYHILVILTDGAISDMNQTTMQIIRGSELPLSIIIVGVGNANFSSMKVLDADSEPLTYNDKTMAADMV